MSDADRRQLFNGVAAAVGPEEARILMEHLPPAGWSQLATRRDVEESAMLTRAEFQRDMALLRSEFGTLQGEFGTLQGEFGTLRGEFGTLRGEFGVLRSELTAQVAGVRADLSQQMVAQTRTMVFALISTMLMAVGAVVALMH